MNNCETIISTAEQRANLVFSAGGGLSMFGMFQSWLRLLGIFLFFHIVGFLCERFRGNFVLLVGCLAHFRAKVSSLFSLLALRERRPVEARAVS